MLLSKSSYNNRRFNVSRTAVEKLAAGLLITTIVIFMVSYQSETYDVDGDFHRNQLVTENVCSDQVLKPDQVNYYNKYWQRMEFDHGQLHLWKAYFDGRPAIGKPVVRIVAMTESKSYPDVNCFLWYKNQDKPDVVKARFLNGYYPWLGPQVDGQIHAIIITCPATNGPPDSVSLSTCKCVKLDNNLAVMNKSVNKKEKFAVCVRWFIYHDQDMSERMIEWLELVKILGASHVFMSELSIHPNMTKVKEHYISNGFVSWTNFTLAGDQPNDSPAEQSQFMYRNESNEILNDFIPLYDCLYQAIGSYEYLVVMDLDEMIVPIKHVDWHDLVTDLRTEVGFRDSFGAPRYYFLDQDTAANDTIVKNISPNFHMLRHIYERPQHEFKTFVNLDSVVSMKQIVLELFRTFQCRFPSEVTVRNIAKGGMDREFVTSTKSRQVWQERIIIGRKGS